MDVALIASECVNTRLKGDDPSIMCKLDIKKAYDHLNWDFLLGILRQMGFGDTWLRCIGFCMKAFRFSILVNGEPVGFFSSERGISQGDLLCPFLFIIAIEDLDSTMRRAISNSLD